MPENQSSEPQPLPPLLEAFGEEIWEKKTFVQKGLEVFEFTCKTNALAEGRTLYAAGVMVNSPMGSQHMTVYIPNVGNVEQAYSAAPAAIQAELAKVTQKIKEAIIRRQLEASARGLPPGMELPGPNGGKNRILLPGG